MIVPFPALFLATIFLIRIIGLFRNSTFKNACFYQIVNILLSIIEVCRYFSSLKNLFCCSRHCAKIPNVLLLFRQYYLDLSSILPRLVGCLVGFRLKLVGNLVDNLVGFTRNNNQKFICYMSDFLIIYTIVKNCIWIVFKCTTYTTTGFSTSPKNKPTIQPLVSFY